MNIRDFARRHNVNFMRAALAKARLKLTGAAGASQSL